MDSTCPELAPISDQTSDYGSRETSLNDQYPIDGFLKMYCHLFEGKFILFLIVGQHYVMLL